jgi:DNA-binding MarR family transcriptional regulator
MAKSSNTKAALARRTWSKMFDFLIHTAPERTKVLARYGLTPNDSRGMASLDSDEGRTMRALAEEWGCDASNATWIVDRLERLGLAERRTPAEDRRVKLVFLTARGVAVRKQIQDAFHTTPRALLTLERADLEALARLVEKLEAKQDT